MNADERTKPSTELERNLTELLEHLGPFRPRQGACRISRDGSLAVEFVAWGRGRSNLCDLEVRLLPRALPSDIPDSEVAVWRRFYEQEAASQVASSKGAAIQGLEILDLPRVSARDLASIRLLLTQEKRTSATPERSRPGTIASRLSAIGKPIDHTLDDLRSPPEPLAVPRRPSVRTAGLNDRGRGMFRSVLLDLPVRVIAGGPGGLFWLPLRHGYETPSRAELAESSQRDALGPGLVRGREVRPAIVPQGEESPAEAVVATPGATEFEFAALSLRPAARDIQFIREDGDGFIARVERLSADGPFRLDFRLFAMPPEAKFTTAHLIATYRDPEDIPLAEAEVELLRPSPEREYWGVTTTLRLLVELENPAEVKALLKAARPSFVIESWK